MKDVLVSDRTGHADRFFDGLLRFFTVTAIDDCPATVCKDIEFAVDERILAHRQTQEVRRARHRHIMEPQSAKHARTLEYCLAPLVDLRATNLRPEQPGL